MPERDAAAVRILAPAVPLLAILLGAGLEQLWPIDLGIALPPRARHWLGGSVAVGAFLGLGLWAGLLFRRDGQSVAPWTPTPRIVDEGPFRLTRNPMYLQMVLVCLGVAVMLASWWILTLTCVGAWVLQRFAILPEEAYLERKFGEAYRGYKRRVRRWL